MHFLSLDQSLELFNSGKLKKFNHGKEQDIGFEFSYFKNGFSGSIRIARTDKKDFITKFDQKAYDIICPAVPSDFIVKDGNVKPKTTVTVTHVDKETALLDTFDYISEEAILFGAEAYNASDFLNPLLSKEMWKLAIKPKTLTGWAWYSEILKNPSQSKNKIIPIKVRPFISEDYNKNKTISNLILFSEAYLKVDFPELCHISDFSIKKMTEGKIKNTIKELLEGQTEHLESLMIQKLSGNVIEKILIYYNTSHEKSKEIKDFFTMISGRKPIDFNYKSYLIDDNTRLILDIEKFEQMKLNLITLIKQLEYGTQQ